MDLAADFQGAAAAGLHWSPAAFWSSTPGEFLSAAKALKKMNSPDEGGDEWKRWRRQTFG
jgi:hypothetical protein